MKKFITTSLFTGMMALASSIFAEEVKEQQAEPSVSTTESLQVVCPTSTEDSEKTVAETSTSTEVQVEETKAAE